MMRVLDLDMDFFLTEPCPLAPLEKGRMKAALSRGVMRK